MYTYKKNWAPTLANRGSVKKNRAIINMTFKRVKTKEDQGKRGKVISHDT